MDNRKQLFNPWAEENEAKQKAKLEELAQAKKEGPHACLKLLLREIKSYSPETIQNSIVTMQTQAYLWAVIGNQTQHALTLAAAALLDSAWKGELKETE